MRRLPLSLFGFPPVALSHAGGYPCCCDAGPGSTSTLPPTSTSTSSAIELIECSECLGGKACRYWAITVDGVTHTPNGTNPACSAVAAPGCEGANGIVWYAKLHPYTATRCYACSSLFGHGPLPSPSGCIAPMAIFFWRHPTSGMYIVDLEIRNQASFCQQLQGNVIFRHESSSPIDCCAPIFTFTRVKPSGFGSCSVPCIDSLCLATAYDSATFTATPVGI